MKLLLIGIVGLCLGQLQAGPVAVPSVSVRSSDSRALFFSEFNKLLDGVAHEAFASLASLEESAGKQVESVEDAIRDLEQLYSEKVVKELANYDDVLNELGSKVSPCFESVSQDVRDIVQNAREKAGQCGKETLERVRLIEQNVEQRIAEGVERVKQIVAIGQKCLQENSWIGDQINCALQNAPVAVSIVEGIVKDAAVLIGKTAREVSEIAKDSEQCLAVAVQDAVAQFNDLLVQVAACLGESEAGQ